MPIVAADLNFWSSASVPIDDTSTSGGAISTVSRPALDPFTAAAVVSLTSSGADTRNATITGRNAGGAIISEVKALTGAVEALSVNSYRDVHSIVLASANANTVTIKQGAGGTIRATIGPNETTVHAMFQRAASEVGAVDRYEKEFAKNQHGTLSLNSAEVKLTSDPAAKITVGCATAKGDTGSVANRKTAPPGVTFVDDNVAQAVPTGILAAGETIGIWVKQSLGAGAAAFRDVYTVQLSGTTTA